MHLYGFFIGLGLIILVSHLPIKSNRFVFGLLLSALVGARAYHVLDYWRFYSVHPMEILFTWKGGLGIYGALLGGLTFILLYSFIKHRSSLRLLNSIAPDLPLVQAIGRWGNYFNHEVYGPAGQPVWLYESLGCLGIFLLLKIFPQNPLPKYLLSYGLLRFFLEFWRTDTWTIHSIKIAQLISLVFIIGGITLLLWPKLTRRKTPST
ncbi:prolipoprotein diacylglyceryl transferase [Patescibacteria group bacterium]|nr:prolipoprotein diacylglyceryl transferase [Patescibacteria group bacterium]